MALITKIRSQFWFILILLGLALGAFIMMDASSFGGGGGRLSLGTVDGEKVDWNEFQQAENAMFYNSKDDIYNTRSTLWNHFVDKSIVENEGSANGIELSDDDVQKLKTGPRLSPVVQQFFINPQTGQFDRTFYNNFIQQLNSNSLDPQSLRQWQYLDNFIKKDHIQGQLIAMASKGIYTPSWMAEENFKQSQSSLDFEYVKIPYDQLPEQELSDADFKSYLKAHESEYISKEETREIEYAIFEATPTSQDSLALFEELAQIKEELIEAEDDSLFIVQYDGTYPLTYLKSTSLPEEIKDIAYSMPVGEIHGPYISNGSYHITKLVDKRAIPDSVEVRHILRRVQTQEEVAPAHALVDSLLELINSGQVRFDSMAVKHSQDGSARSGGDLGITYPGGMVSQFNDLIFYQAEVGKAYKVATQFGLHIVEVLSHKYDGENERQGVRLASLSTPIIPSENTQNEVIEKANVLLSKSNTVSALVDNAERDGVRLEITNPLGKNDFLIPGLTGSQTNRDLVQWVYKSKTDLEDVAPEVFIYDNAALYFNQFFVVAGLKSINPEGTPDLDNIREVLRPLVVNDKKTTSISGELSNSSLATISNQYNVSVDTSTAVKYNSRFLPGLGNEPNVLAAAIKGAIGQVSGPIKGNAGVFFVKPTLKNENPEMNNLAFYRRTSALGTKSSASSQLIKSLRESSKIEDKRSTYY